MPHFTTFDNFTSSLKADARTNYRPEGIGLDHPIIDPNESYDVAVQSLIDDMMTGFMKLDDPRGEISPSRQANGVSDQVAQLEVCGHNVVHPDMSMDIHSKFHS